MKKRWWPVVFVLTFFTLLFITLPSIIYSVSAWIWMAIFFPIRLIIGKPISFRILIPIIYKFILPTFLILGVPTILFFFCWEPLYWIFFGWMIIYFTIRIFSGAHEYESLIIQGWQDMYASEKEIHDEIKNDMVTQKLTIKANEALKGTKKIIVRKGKKLEVTIPPGVKTGTLVKLSGALQITDGYYGDLFVQINIKNMRRIVYTISSIAIIFIIISSIIITRNITTSTDNGYSVSYNGYMTIFNNKQPDDFPNYGKPVHLINNDNAVNPTWKELKAFLYLDKTDEIPYDEEDFECASFAEELHNNAEARGIKAAFVSLFFSDEFIGHALNAFQTTDKGLVYIDCSPGIGIDFVAYIEEDKGYGMIFLEMAESFDYNYFINYDDEFKISDLGIVDLVYIYW